MIKKRTTNFLILEVLIAFLLIAMCILPFSSYPYKVFSKELHHLESMAMEPYFTAAFFEVYHQKEEGNVTLKSLEIPFGKNKPLHVKRDVTIKRSKVTEEVPNSLITILLTFKTKNATIVREKCFFEKKTKG